MTISTIEKAKEFKEKLEYRFEKLGIYVFKVSIDCGFIDDASSIQGLDDIFFKEAND